MNSAAFIRNVLTLMSGKIASQIISVALVPIVARLFTPDDFGVATIFITVANLLAVVLPLRYFRASLLIEDNVKADMLLAISAWMLLLGCVLTFMASLVLFITEDFGLDWLILFLPIAGWIYGMNNILRTQHTRQKTFNRVAISDVTQTLTMGSSRIVFGLAGSSIAGLVFGYLLAGLARLFILAKSSLNPLTLYTIKQSWPDCKRLMLEYKDFPLHNMPSGLLQFLSGKFPVLVMGFMFAPATVGFYAMSDRLVRTPVVSVAISIREVFIRKLTVNKENTVGMMGMYSKLTLGMFLLGLLPFTLLSIYGSELLTIILGENWVEAGDYVQILAPWYFSVWIVSGSQPVLMRLRKQVLWLSLQIWLFLIRVSVFVVAYVTGDDILTVLLWFSGVNVFASIVTFLLVICQIRKAEASV